MSKKTRDQLANVDIRKELERDVAAFLASGNEIQQIPAGVSGQDPQGRSKHIVINSRRKR